MPTFSRFMSPLVIVLSLTTATGLFVHDLHIDKATKLSLALPAAIATYKALEGAAQFSDMGSHTHTERSSMAEAVQHLRSATTSRMLPREDSRKYVLSKKVAKGVHAFDGYYMPLGEL